MGEVTGFVILFLRVVRNFLTGKGALEQGPEGLERIMWIFGKQGSREQDSCHAKVLSEHAGHV